MSSDTYLPTRTLGDGMENAFSKNPEIKVPLLKKASSSILMSMKPVEPTSKVINLVPKYVPQDKKVSNIILSKPKEPKFVPYEPYKAAVQPIKTQRVKARVTSSVDAKPSKNNVEIQELVNQMSVMRTSEMSKLKMDALKEDEVIPRQQWQKQKDAYEIDIKNLKETKSHLENQLKFQAQVNSELKTLLVAAVGEDLESRVQHLTEDKLSLARALLNSANHLTSHQEQTEWLSGQCEVWRSKFLASSLMVEELARWKSALTKRTNDLQEVIKRMLDDHTRLQKQMLTTFNNLKAACEKTNTECSLKTGDIMELGSTNLELSGQVAAFLGVDGDERKVAGDAVMVHCATEKLALKMLKNPVSLASSQDVLCNALVDAAHSMTTGDQRYVQSQLLHPCCAHCKGDVQNI